MLQKGVAEDEEIDNEGKSGREDLGGVGGGGVGAKGESSLDNRVRKEPGGGQFFSPAQPEAYRMPNGRYQSITPTPLAQPPTFSKRFGRSVLPI